MSVYKLFTDKSEIFECNISLEGASLSKSFARLVLETKDLNLMFKGKISSNGKCQVPIKKLRGLLDENIRGNLKLEIIAEDTYFIPWESKFEIETKKKVTVEVKSQTKPLIESSKPRVRVNRVKNSKITSSEKQHVINIMKLLIKENINIKNLKMKKNKLNNIIAVYQQKNPINEEIKPTVLKGVAKVLAIRK